MGDPNQVRDGAHAVRMGTALTRCAEMYPWPSFHRLRSDPAGSFDRQGGWNSKSNWGGTHDAPGIGGIMPVINQDQIRVVLDKLNVRGPT